MARTNAFLWLLWVPMLVLPWAAPARAADPARQAEVMHIARQLRCVVCQNQTVADSSAPLAVDFRDRIAVLLDQGRSEREVLDHMVARYGEFVLYKPPLRPGTWALWLGPFVLLGAVAGALGLHLRQRRQQAPTPLSDAQRNEARRVLGLGDRP